MKDNAHLMQQDFLRFFNLEDKDIRSLAIHHENDEVHLSVELNPSTQHCPSCMTPTSRIHGYHLKKIKHSILNDIPCVIDYRARRYLCPRCRKTFYEPNPFTMPDSRISMMTVYNVLKDLKNPHETFTTAARRHFISTTTAQSIFDKYVHISRRTLPRITCIDEVYAYHSSKGDYVCVLLDYDSRNIIDLLPSRKKDHLINYFSFIPRSERLKVQFVCFDMWETYRIVARQMFPNAKLIIDKFHVYQELYRRVDRIRCHVMNQYSSKLKVLKKKKENNTITRQELVELNEVDVHYYVLKKFNWLLFWKDKKIKKGETSKTELLNPNQSKRYNHKLKGYYNYDDLLRMMTSYDPILEEAVNLKDALDYFYTHCTHHTADEKLNELIRLFSSSSIKELCEFSSTLNHWHREIVNSFITVLTVIDKNNKERHLRIHNAFIESRNKAIKHLKHNSNGYLNWERFRNRVLFSLNNDTTFYLYPPVDRKGDVTYVIEPADKDIHRPGLDHSRDPETE